MNRAISTLTLALITGLSLPNAAHAGWLDWLFGKDEASSETTVADPLAHFTAAITEQAKAQGGSLIKDLAKDMNGSVATLASLLGGSPEQVKTLNNTLGAFQENFSAKDFTTLLTSLSGLTSGGLNEEQQGALTNTMKAATAFGLQPFLSDSPYKSDVEKVITSLRSGNYVSAIQPMIKLSENAKLSPEHQGLVDAAKGYFQKLGSSKALDSLKGLLK